MEWTLWIVAYLVVGVVLTAILWKVLSIQWNAEAGDTKAMIILSPVGWPLVLLLFGALWLFNK